MRQRASLRKYAFETVAIDGMLAGVLSLQPRNANTVYLELEQAACRSSFLACIN